jgi:hypothetical protein
MNFKQILLLKRKVKFIIKIMLLIISKKYFKEHDLKTRTRNFEFKPIEISSTLFEGLPFV